MSPVELVKVAQQCSTNKNGYAMIPAIQNISTNRTFMSGLNATLLRDGIPHGVWFVAYDVSKVTLMSYRNINNFIPTSIDVEDNVPVSVSLTSGAIAATVAWAVGYPADLIKTRIQATSSSLGQAPTGIVETAQKIIQEADGRILTGLYRGFGMKLVRSVPASMIGFTVYEGVKERILRQVVVNVV
jgi:solute carrier family 25 (mitochondrial carnitine/acylcarnitine transporter), member 20/29